MSYDCYCDYDPADIYRASKPRARKRHKCEECGAPILPGEQYERVFGVWEGYASTHKTCARCFDLRQWVQNSIPCFCWAHGNMIEDAKVCIDDVLYRAKDEVRGVKFGFLRKLAAVERFKREHRQR